MRSAHASSESLEGALVDDTRHNQWAISAPEGQGLLGRGISCVGFRMGFGRPAILGLSSAKVAGLLAVTWKIIRRDVVDARRAASIPGP